MVVGSDEPHYTASKIFPYILARKPLLVVFHEASSVVTIVRETNSAALVTYSAQRPPALAVDSIAEALEQMLREPDRPPQTGWAAFETYTTRAMASRLATVFNRVVEQER